MAIEIDNEALMTKFFLPEEWANDFDGVVNAVLLSVTRHIGESIFEPKGLNYDCQSQSGKKIILDDDDIKRIQTISSQNMPFYLSVAPIPKDAERLGMVELYGDLSERGQAALFGEICYQALKDDYLILNLEDLFGVERVCPQEFKQELKQELDISTQDEEEAYSFVMLILQSAATSAFHGENLRLAMPKAPEEQSSLGKNFKKATLQVEDAELIEMGFYNRVDAYMKEGSFGGNVEEQRALYKRITSRQKSEFFNASMPEITKDYCEQPVPQMH